MRVRAREREAGGDGGGYRAIGRWGGGLTGGVWMEVRGECVVLFLPAFDQNLEDRKVVL